MAVTRPTITDVQARPRMGVRAMLTAFTVIALSVMAMVGATSLWGARQASKAATQTFVAKDVTADVLPPPLYLIEMRLVLSQGVEGTLMPERVKAEVARLKSEYEARFKFWRTTHPTGWKPSCSARNTRQALSSLLLPRRSSLR